jgi:hypothetical protein
MIAKSARSGGRGDNPPVVAILSSDSRYGRSVTVELDGRRWMPVSGATATAGDFAAAWSLIREIHRQCLWSPWVMQDRARWYDAAWKTCEQWTSAGPGSPAMTAEEAAAEADRRMAEADARFLAGQAQAEQDRAERAEQYDPGRAQARLALLEEQAVLADTIRQRDELLAGGRSWLAGDEDGRKLLASLERRIAAKTKEADELAAVVGDPETVPDAQGRLPAERRAMALALFKSQRATEVRDLRARIAESQATLKSLTGKAERAELREVLRKDRAWLAYVEEMPPLEASGMCSECVSPAWHTPGVTYSLAGAGETGGPCPAWPRWAGRVTSIRDALCQPAQGSLTAPPPPPEPIAVLAPGMSIEDAVAQLAAIQADHPGAQVRQGRGHRWEIWPAPGPARPDVP